MALALMLAVVVVAVSVRPLTRWLDRATDAPVMRREINAGTRRWRGRKRLADATRRPRRVISAGDERTLDPDDDDGDD